MKTRLCKHTAQALDDTGLPWRIEKGTRHMKIILNERLVGILPYGSGTARPHERMNTITQIKRRAREMTGLAA
jgi:hypothetical protein